MAPVQYVHILRFPARELLTQIQPCTKRDFMEYLTFVEHAAENLQFYVWHEDYVKRFKKAPESDTALAPEWTQAMEDQAWTRMQRENREKTHAKEAGVGAEIFEGTDFEKKALDTSMPRSARNDPFTTPPRTASTDSKNPSTTNDITSASTYRSQASTAFTSSGARVPCKYHPL